MKFLKKDLGETNSCPVCGCKLGLIIAAAVIGIAALALAAFVICKKLGCCAECTGEEDFTCE